MAPQTHTKHKYSENLALHARLNEHHAMEQKAFFDVRIMQRSFSQVSYHECVVEAILSNNVPRVTTVLNDGEKTVYALKRSVGLVKDAAIANCTWYSADEKDLCVLLYRVGGPSVCNALSQAHLLPSLSHRWGVAKRDMVECLCECAPPKRFEALADQQEVMEKLQSAEWHLAKYAPVVPLL